MLDFIAKQPPQSEISELNKEKNQTSNGDVTPARTNKLPPLPVLPEFKTPSESGTPVARFKTPSESETPVARVMKQEERFSIPTPSQVQIQ